MTEITEQPTVKQIAGACLSYRHDFGLLSVEEQNVVAEEAKSWWKAIAKEVNTPSSSPIVESAAKNIQEPWYSSDGK